MEVTIMDKKNVFNLDINLVNDLLSAFQHNGWSNSDIKTASQGDFLGTVLKLMNENYVNLNQTPEVPNGEKILHCNGGGLWKFNPKEIFVSGKYKYSQNELFENGFNANLLDYLLKHLDLIPEDWKIFGKIFFPGTFYTTDNDFEQIRCITWGTKWGTELEPKWWSESFVFNEILKSDDDLVFVMRKIY